MNIEEAQGFLEGWDKAIKAAAEIANEGVEEGWIKIGDSGLKERILSLLSTKEAGK